MKTSYSLFSLLLINSFYPEKDCQNFILISLRKELHNILNSWLWSTNTQIWQVNWYDTLKGRFSTLKTHLPLCWLWTVSGSPDPQPQCLFASQTSVVFQHFLLFSQWKYLRETERMNNAKALYWFSSKNSLLQDRGLITQTLYNDSTKQKQTTNQQWSATNTYSKLNTPYYSKTNTQHKSTYHLTFPLQVILPHLGSFYMCIEYFKFILPYPCIMLIQIQYIYLHQCDIRFWRILFLFLFSSILSLSKNPIQIVVTL